MKCVSIALVLIGIATQAFAADELVPVRTADGTQFSYVLTTNAPQKIGYAVILMPGGGGQLNPRLTGGRIAMALSGNFLIRSRDLFADRQFVAASTDATTAVGRIEAIVADLEKRYGKLHVYVIGTSASTEATMDLAEKMDGRVAGFVHSSSFNRIASFDPRKFKSRQLIVLHEKDTCRYTWPSNGRASHDKYGTDLIAVSGGTTGGDACEAYAYHGYNGVERETVDKMKAWILKGAS